MAIFINLKKVIKKNQLIRRAGKKIKVYIAFFFDAKAFSENFIEEAELQNDYRYSIMLIVHSLEKGMCMSNLRPFGQNKVIKLISFLKKMESRGIDNFEYNLGLSILREWAILCEKNNWTAQNAYHEVKSYIKLKNCTKIKTGKQFYVAPKKDLSQECSDVIFSRHSIRNFRPDLLKQEDVKFAINCFIQTPTACNRQMCGVLYIENQNIKKILDERIIGLPGFDKSSTHYFIITYDLKAFAYSGERQQGLLNVGMCATNFINALHSKGIGACCLQWSNNMSEDIIVRKALGMQVSERIGLIIGCGYYKDTATLIPCSARKPMELIYRIV